MCLVIVNLMLVACVPTTSELSSGATSKRELTRLKGPMNFLKREKALQKRNRLLQKQCGSFATLPPITEFVVTRNIYGGNDRRIEDAGQSLIKSAAVCFAGNSQICKKGAEYLTKMATIDAPRKDMSNLDRSEILEKYTVNTYYLPQAAMLAATLRYRGFINGEEDKKISKWLQKLAVTFRKDHFKNKKTNFGKHGHSSLERAQNHYISSASAQMSVGAFADNHQLFEVGLQQWRDTLSTMRDDGSLPSETSRGSRAIWYTGITLTKLMRLAEIAEAQGIDFYNQSVSGKTYHDAVTFMLDVSENPELIFKYARYDVVSGGDKPHTKQENSNSSGGQYSWVAPYISRFPNHANSKRIVSYQNIDWKNKNVHVLQLEAASLPKVKNFTYLHLDSRCFLE